MAKAFGAIVVPDAEMAGVRRCDSARSRRSSRSWARREGASSGRVFEGDEVADRDCSVLGVVCSGGRDDWGVSC